VKALDTNVIVRLLTRDDPVQAELAASEIRGGRVLVPLTVLLETEWVLRHAYGFERADVSRALRGLVDLEGAVVQEEAVVRVALRWHERGMDLADALHRASARDCTELVTFDRRFAASAAREGHGVAVRLLSPSPDPG
jgi:predicted nucleic-acid-binding protein